MPVLSAGGRLSRADGVTRLIAAPSNACPVPAYHQAGYPEFPGTKLNPGDAGADITVSERGLVATNAASVWESIRATMSRTDARFFEATARSATYNAVGFANNSGGLTSDYIGNALAQGIMYSSDGSVYYGGASVASLGAYGAGDIIGAAYDPATTTARFSKNGAWSSAISCPGVGGTYYAALSLHGAGALVNFGASGYNYAAPAGFQSYDAQFTEHFAAGDLVGPASSLAGTATRFRAHDTAGAIVGPGATVTGTAVHQALHTSSGALVGQGSTIAGTATRFRAHATSGALTGQGSTLAGTAVHSTLHATTGALTGQIGAVAGAATRFRAHAATGALTGPGALVIGATLRFRAFATTGALAGQGSSLAATADHVAATGAHAATAALVGQGATLNGVAARVRIHAATGELTGPFASIAGVAERIERIWDPVAETAANWTPETPAGGAWSAQTAAAGTWTPETQTAAVWTPQAVPAASWN